TNTETTLTSARPCIREGGRAHRPSRPSPSAREAAPRGPAVEPLERVVIALGRAAAPEVVAHQALDAMGVVDAPHLARHEDDARGARDARSLVEREAGVEIVV